VQIAGMSLEQLRDGAELVVTVAAAADAGIFTALAEQPTDAAALARRTALDERAVTILLPILVDLELLHEQDGKYQLTGDARRTLGDPDSPEYLAGGLPLWLRNLNAWTRLPEVLRSGHPIREEPAADRREWLARFMAGMAAAPAERVRRLVEGCLQRRPGARTVLDLGGGPGHLAREFVNAGLQATLYDTPETIEFVGEAYGLERISGLTLVGGDFLTEPLPAGPFDIVLLSNITHMLSPRQNQELIAKVHASVAPRGTVAIADFVRGRSPRAARFALVMLLRAERGDTYSLEEYRQWLEAAGFRDLAMQDLDPDRQLITAERA
jgi:SAM-dependent methyltransferase